jgi:glycosyltransferase domain-containing protein
MTKIIIPTYNRSAKLARTLSCYHSFGPSFVPDIVVLDGSDEAYMKENQRVCSLYPNLQYTPKSGSGFLPRLIEYLEQMRGSTPVCLATDEDVFLPDYIRQATKFLNTRPDYSMLLGRYVTFLRPLGPFHRISHHRDVITILDIKQKEMQRRIALLCSALSVGCAPVFWGIRRVDQLLESLKQQDRLYYQTSQELVDQIILAHQGMIKITDLPMLLRDETNLEYLITKDRQHDFNYFPPEECNLLSSLLVEVGGPELLEAAGVFIDRYSLEYVAPGAPCLAVQSHLKAYTKYEPLQRGGKCAMHSLVYMMMKIAIIFTEIFTAAREIRVLKSMYTDTALNVFVRKVKSNQIL